MTKLFACIALVLTLAACAGTQSVPMNCNVYYPVCQSN